MQKLKEKLLELGKQKQGQRTDLLSTMDKRLLSPHNTQKEIAKELDWGSGKIARADVISKKVSIKRCS